MGRLVGNENYCKSKLTGLSRRQAIIPTVLSYLEKNNWVETARTGKLAENISANPYQTYKRKGWVNWDRFVR